MKPCIIQENPNFWHFWYLNLLQISKDNHFSHLNPVYFSAYISQHFSSQVLNWWKLLFYEVSLIKNNNLNFLHWNSYNSFVNCDICKRKFAFQFLDKEVIHHIGVFSKFPEPVHESNQQLCHTRMEGDAEIRSGADWRAVRHPKDKSHIPSL